MQRFLELASDLVPRDWAVDNAQRADVYVANWWASAGPFVLPVAFLALCALLACGWVAWTVHARSRAV